MEEKKTPADTADTNPQVDLMDKEPIAEAMEATPGPVASATKTTRSLKLTIVSVVVVVVALAGILYALEKDGRVNSNVFSGIIDQQSAQSEVAVVNGESIAESQLAVASTQLAQAAAAQGADPADPEIQASIRSQALDLIIGTTLLTQTAEAEGVVVTQEEVDERLAAIEADAGGAEVLATRMTEFGITMESLEEDIRSELIISKLLDTVVSDEDIEVTEEEILSAYDGAAAPGVELPPLEEVRAQIETQLQQAKGQALIEEYVQQLRTDADIEIIQ
jgi:FKBP-type peptidyl-prolyl cis-trans isomerase (trigger factor)